ncbi:MAG TPA: universal stress protein [Polyangiaceae bacterium]
MHVLIGTDGSELSIAAATRALGLLGRPRSLCLLAVGETPAEETAGMVSGFAGGIATQQEVNAAWRAVEAELEAALDATASAIRAVEPDVPIARRTEIGDPGLVLCRLASELGAELVVVGSRGRGVLKGALLGSVSSRVVHEAPCPVLVIRAET